MLSCDIHQVIRDAFNRLFEGEPALPENFDQLIFHCRWGRSGFCQPACMSTGWGPSMISKSVETGAEPSHRATDRRIRRTDLRKVIRVEVLSTRFRSPQSEFWQADPNCNPLPFW